MAKQKTVFSVDGPILAGSLSQVRSKCGKSNCRCHTGKKDDLHGPYYKWSTYVEGRMTNRTLSPKAAKECERRIANLEKLQAKIADAIQKSQVEFIGSLQKK